MISAPAHPRSRGENTGGQLTKVRHPGSSPLTRGKRPRYADQAVRPRLIPAHAGKTAPRSPRSRPAPAHPRSRGENRWRARRGHRGSGSSPLTRGKHRTVVPRGTIEGLIPAHAGKTQWKTHIAVCVSAHPRSRGENQSSGPTGQRCYGSSPLTRGKPQKWGVSRVARRLIPAHAGKTCSSRAAAALTTAHPRSRGEN